MYVFKYWDTFLGDLSKNILNFYQCFQSNALIWCHMFSLRSLVQKVRVECCDPHCCNIFFGSMTLGNVLVEQVYPNMRSAMVDIYKRKGVFGFYSGLTPTLMEIVPYAGLQFGFYDSFKRWTHVSIA